MQFFYHRRHSPVETNMSTVGQVGGARNDHFKEFSCKSTTFVGPMGHMCATSELKNYVKKPNSQKATVKSHLEIWELNTVTQVHRLD